MKDLEFNGYTIDQIIRHTPSLTVHDRVRVDLLEDKNPYAISKIKLSDAIVSALTHLKTIMEAAHETAH